MDTSIEYINMCREAKELQKSWKHSAWDYVYFDDRNLWRYWGGDNGFFVLSEYETDGDLYGPSVDLYDHFKYHGAWLPRLDQLLEMVGEGYPHEMGVTIKLTSRTKAEQEILGFLMFVKYNKKWDGKTWIPII